MSFSQKCELEELALYHQKINKLINSNQPNASLLYQDSIEIIANQYALYKCQEYWASQLDLTEAFELKDQFEEALNKYHEIIRSAKAQAFAEIEANAYLSIARIHETIGRPQDCTRNLANARIIIDKNDLQKTRSRYAVRNASYHRIYANKDSAALYARMAIDLGRKYNVFRSEMDGYLLMGIVSQDPDSILHYFDESVQLFLKQKNYIGAASQKLNKSQTLIDLGKEEEARKEVNSALKLLDKVEEKTKEYHFYMSNCYLYLTELLKKENNFDSAYHYQSLATQHKLQATHLTDQVKINEIEFENALQQELLHTQYYKNLTRIFYLIFASGFLVLMVILLMYYNIRKKRKQIAKQNEIISQNNKELEETLKRRNLLLAEVHHRVKNNLQVIISLLLLKSEFTQEKNTRTFLEDLASQIKGIALIHDQLYQSEEFDLINFREYLKQLFENFNSILSEDEKFTYAIDVNDIFFNLETCLPIGIICTELINNSLKYGRIPGKTLELSVLVKNTLNVFHLTFTDNGKGFPDDNKTKNGLGSLLMNNMVRQLIGKIDFYNQDGARTELTFTQKNTSKL